MKKLYIMLLSILFCMVGVHAQSFEVDGISYNITKAPDGELSGEVEVTGGEIKTEIEFPETVTYSEKTYTVTSIGDNAFSGRYDSSNSTKKYVIPGTVKTIGNSAFYDNYYLEEVEFHEGLQTIGAAAFGYNFVLKEIRLPSTLLSIGSDAFITNQYSAIPVYCTAATPPNIHSTAFEGRTTGALHVTYGEAYREADYWKEFNKIVAMDDAIPFVDANVKATCVSQWDTNGDGELSYIEAAAVTSLNMRFNTSITSFDELQYFKELTSIGENTFSGCSALVSVKMGEKVSGIGNSAFKDCTSLSSITIPTSVTSIGESAFSGCSTLTSVSFSENMTSIDKDAFNGCNSLTSFTIPESVTSIGEDAFNGCSNLTSVEVKNPIPVAITQNTFSNRTNAILAVPTGSITAYLAADYWKEFKEIISLDDAIFFADENVKAVCVSNWDTNGDGELSYAEAAAVTSLEEAFRSNESITSFNELQHFKGLTTIAGLAFYDCKNLSSIIIPNSVTTIDEWAFGFCNNLTSIILSNQLMTIGNYAFKDCTSLSSINIPNSVTSLGEFAFMSCNGLNSVTIGNGVTILRAGTFYGCSNLTTIQIPNGLTIIEDAENEYSPMYSTFSRGNDPNYGVFTGCSNLTSVFLGDHLTTIGIKAFEGCSSLSSITIPNSTTSIGELAFKDCSGLTSVTIGNGLTSLKGGTFYGCSGLTSITIPNNVTNIEDEYQGNWGMHRYGVFEGCISLTSVTIGSGVTDIGNYAFRDCVNLGSVKMGKNVISIGGYAFNGCTSLSSITIPNSVTSLGARAFENCGALTSVKLSNQLTNIEEYTFANCTSLTSITIPNSMTTISTKAFSECSMLTSAILGDQLMTIEAYAFEGCTSISSIAIPNSVTSLGEFAFYGCTGLTSVTIGSGIKTLKGGTFSDCSNLTTLTLPNGLTTIEDEAWYRRGGTSIGAQYGAFSRCYNLTSVTIPNSVTSIGSHAFYNCPLTSIKLPESLTTMGGEVFAGCPLNSIELPDAFTVIPEGLFANNDFQYIKLGNNVKSIGKNAFGSSKTVIEIGTSTPPTIATDAFPNIEYLSDINVIVPDAKAETAYHKAAVWQDMTFANQNNISEVTVETAGDLGIELITQCNMTPAKVVSLKVNGTINVADFNQMLVNMKSLLRLDLTDCDITEIPDNALKDKQQLRELILPTKLQTIGQSAFQGCTFLQTLTMQTGLQTIGKSAFQGCGYLTGQLDLPSTVTTVGESAFVGTGYTSVKMPNALKTIGSYAFHNLSISQKLTLPKKVTSVGAYAFAGTKITGLEIPDGVTSIGDYAFASTPIQGHVTIPDGVTYLGVGAFQNSQLSTAFLPNSIETLSDGLFQGCPNLDLVYIPDNFTGLASSTFDGCGALTILRLSANLASMGEYALQSTPLEYIKIPSQVEILSRGVLKNCKNLEFLSLPASLKTVEGEAFYGCTALRNLSVEALDPPTIKDKSAIRGINTDLCLISIPTQSYRKYVLAEYWGQFVQMRNDIAVETTGNGEIAFESVEEGEDEEEVQAAPRRAAARASRHGQQLATDEESMTIANNGSSVYVPQQGKVRFYIIPAEGEQILSATLDGENIMPYIVDGVYTATADKRNAKLVVVFSNEGQGSAGLQGDVNGDGTVSVTDVGCVINYILEQVPETFIYAAADMNGDESISVTDVGYIINYILSDGTANNRAANHVTYSYGVPMLMPNTDGYVLTLDGADAFIGFQMDILVPEDANSCNVQLKNTDSDHQLICRRLSSGHYRVVCYSPTNETFQKGLTDLLTFASESNMTISNIRFTTAGLEEVRFADMGATPTGIANVTGRKTNDIKVYTLDGRLYRIVHVKTGENPLKDLQPGVYLINEHKYILK